MSRNQNRAFGEDTPEAPITNETPQQSAPPPMPSEPTPEPVATAFNFVVPTEMVDLPSKGKYYPEGHPLNNQESIEIKHMTAKEEDILTSVSFLKKGIALDKMLQSIIVDKRIKVEDLLIGDKNALLVASRIFGYGSDYKVQVACQHCDASFDTIFDLNALTPQEEKDIEAIVKTDNKTFVVTLPKSSIVVEFRLLTSRDETTINTNKNSGTLALLKLITVSVNSQTDGFFIERALQSLPILDTTILKKAYGSMMPDVDMTQTVECTECGEAFEMGVPLSAEFFWPNL